MSETLFGSQVPGITNESDGAPGLTLGTRIRVTADGTISGVRWRFPDTLPSSAVQYRLWRYNPGDDTAGSLIASGSFSSPVAGVYNTASFTPISVTANDEFVVAVWTPNRYVASLNYFVGDIVVGNLVGPDDAPGERRNGRFVVNASPTFPASGSPSAPAYHVDFVFDEGGADPSTVDLTPAEFTLSAVAVTAVPGVVSVDLTPAAMSFAAVAVTPAPGVVTVDLAPAMLALAAVPLTATPGMVTVALTPATFTLTAVPIDFTSKEPGVATPSGVTVAPVASGTNRIPVASGRP